MINEEKAKLVNKMLSLADKLDKEAERMCWSANGLCDKQNRIRKEKGLWIHKFQHTYTLFRHKVVADATVYHFSYERVYRERVVEIEKTSFFNPQTQRLTLTFCTLYAYIYHNHCKYTIQEAITRYYEWVKGIGDGVNPVLSKPMDDARRYAFSKIKGWEENDRNIFIAQGVLDPSWVMYYSHWLPQDILINSYEKECISSFEPTMTEQTFRFYKERVRWLKKNILKKDQGILKSIKEYEQFGFDAENMLNYISKGLRRFRRRLQNERIRVSHSRTEPIFFRRPLSRKEEERSINFTYGRL